MHSAFMSVFYPITFLNAVQVSKSSQLPHGDTASRHINLSQFTPHRAALVVTSVSCLVK